MLQFRPQENEPPSSNYATLDTRNGHLVLDFDDSTNESAVFSGILPDTYAGGGLTIDLFCSMSSATSGNVVMNAEIERVGTSQDIDTDSFSSANTTTQAVAGTSGVPFIAQITFTDGADMDSLAAGERFRLRVTRNASSGSDTATGDLELQAVHVKES